MRRLMIDENGGVALETALVLPAYLLIILGIFSVAFLLWTENSIQFAAEAAARCASVDTAECGSVLAIQNAAIGWSNGVLTTSNIGDVFVDTGATCSSGPPPITGIAVAIKYTVTFFVISTKVAAEACYPSLS